MPIAAPLRPLRRVAPAWALACALFAGPALGFDTQAENALIASLREEAIGLELGNGLEKEPERAAMLYCEAARLGDMDSQFRLGWMYTNGNGVQRSDATAAFFFQIAAEQGMDQAQHMLRVVGGPTTDVPECMREKAPAKPPAPAGAVTAVARAKPPRIDAPPNILSLVTKIAPEYRVEPQLALAIIEAESNFDTVALSPKNAKGLMQLIPATAARFNVRNPYDPAQNIRGGVAYLSWLLAYFEGDVTLVAAAYNAGEGAVERYRGVPPYRETRAYVQKILHLVGAAVHPFDAKVTSPSPQLALIRQPQRWR
jgi:TPR repeat protein